MTVTSFPERSSLHAASARIANPRREILIGGTAVGLFFGVFMLWSAFAPLDAAAHATGQVTVSGSRQLVQHLDGGVVSALLVKEGDVVKAGQPLVELNAAAERAAERSLASQVILRQTQLARVRAETLGQPMTMPEAAATASPEDQAVYQDAFILAQHELEAREAAARTQLAVLSRRVDQLNEQIAGGRVQIEANERQSKLLVSELAGVNELYNKGYAPATRVRSLERSAAELEGANGAQRGESARLQAGIGEIRLQMTQSTADRAKQLAEESRTAEAELAALTPQWEAARQKLNASRLVAPVSGTVMAMRVHTVGGVVGAGQNLMEIVPLNPSLVMEARVPARDIEGMHSKADVEVRFPGIGNRRTPVVHGDLTTLSPDTVVDERTGAAYYTASVTVRDSELAKLATVTGKRPDIRPGMPVEILIRKRKRSLLQFMVEPLSSTLWSQGG